MCSTLTTIYCIFARNSTIMAYKVRGFLHKVLEERKIGVDRPRSVRDFVLTLDAQSRWPQKRKFQAIDIALVKKLDTIPLNTEVEVEFILRGREFESRKTSLIEYYNIDEIISIEIK